MLETRLYQDIKQIGSPGLTIFSPDICKSVIKTLCHIMYNTVHSSITTSIISENLNSAPL